MVPALLTVEEIVLLVHHLELGEGVKAIGEAQPHVRSE
jgi:hypothetical protein